MSRAAINVENIPPEMKDTKRWLVWKFIDGTKVPYNFRTGRKADSTDPAVWTSFDDALAASTHYDGIGFAMGDGWAYVDLDHCIVGGQITEFAQSIVREVHSYTEISPGRDGLKIIAHAYLVQNSTCATLELKVHGYTTITGNHLPDTPTTVETRGIEIAAIAARTCGVELLPREAGEFKPAYEFPAVCHRQERHANINQLIGNMVWSNAYDHLSPAELWAFVRGEVHLANVNRCDPPLVEDQVFESFCRRSFQGALRKKPNRDDPLVVDWTVF